MKSLILLLSLFLISCGDSEKLSGSPITSGDVETFSQLQISVELCQKIRSCFPSNLSSCELRIAFAKNITRYMGVREDTYPYINSISSGISQGKLLVEPLKEASCYQAIRGTSCMNSILKNSYSPSDPENLDSIGILLTQSTDCNQYLTEAPSL